MENNLHVFIGDGDMLFCESKGLGQQVFQYQRIKVNNIKAQNVHFDLSLMFLNQEMTEEVFFQMLAFRWFQS